MILFTITRSAGVQAPHEASKNHLLLAIECLHPTLFDWATTVRSIESMDDLFQRSLWTMYKHAYPTEEEKVRSDVQEARQGNFQAAAERQNRQKSTSVHVENAT